MSKSETEEVPVVLHGKEKWLVLNRFANSGELRAVKISKPRQVPDFDGHHCNEVSVKSSIRYHPKGWVVD